jgi:dienelactone hydrolase
MAADLFLPDNADVVPVLIYAHGFNGFKDWGGNDLIAAAAMAAGFAWLRFNFSHNGTTPEHSQEFVDLEAFAANTYSRELADLKAVVDWTLATDNPFLSRIDTTRLGLIGHSKGGAEAIIFTAEEPRIQALATWAAVSAARTPWDTWEDSRMQEWESAGRTHIANGRTGQQMPLDHALVADYNANSERFNVIRAAGRIHVPWLICHGSADTSVPVSHAERLHAANPESELFTLDTDHVLGRKHPWASDRLPDATIEVLDKCFGFFRRTLA